MEFRWVSLDEADAVADVRLRCYGAGEKDLESIRGRVDPSRGAISDDFLLAVDDGRAVGTATALPMRMWLRGGVVSCQGVAWVGATKVARRRSAGATDERGVASQVMAEVLAQARRRGHVVSALMPFRASYYAHFGYGLTERRCDWTVPLSIMPVGDPSTFRFAELADYPHMHALRQREVEAGQCDIERPIESWVSFIARLNSGFVVVEEAADPKAAAGSKVRSWLAFENARDQAGRDVVQVSELHYLTLEDLRRQLVFLGSLRDQYGAAQLSLPADLSLNRLLREPQIPHRAVNHAIAEARPYTRMQARVLDHRKLLESLNLTGRATGTVSLNIRESEGASSRFTVEFDGGKLVVLSAGGQAPEVAMTDVTWASIVTGDLRASEANELGLLECADAKVLELLDELAAGPAPFCRDYF